MAKTPKEIVAKLNDAYAKAIADPVVRQKIIDAGIDPLHGSPQEFSSYMKSENVKWAKVVAEGNIKVE